MKAELLIADLIDRTKSNLNAAVRLEEFPSEKLNFRSADGSWSALECIEHLNLYGEYYLPEIANRINTNRYPSEENFRPGLLGDYFAKMMLPGKGKKIKTFKDKDPIGKNLDKQVLKRFIDQQKQTLNLLENARRVSLSKTRTGISISKWISLKLGDTFRVVIYHNQRHLKQAFETMNLISPEKKTEFIQTISA